MKKIIIILILAIPVSIYIGFNLLFSYKGATEARVFRIGTECDLPPNNWAENIPTDSNVPLENEDDLYADGYDIQIAKLVAKSMGAELEVFKLSWHDLVPALNDHEIDAIFSGMLDTSERKKSMSFSDVYEVQSGEYCIMVNKKGKYADAKNFKDFIGATFVAQKNSNFDRAIAQIKGAIHMPPVMMVQEIFDKLRNREADATVIDLESAKTYERVYPGFIMIKLPKGEGFKFDFTGICAGVRKDDTRLLNKINGALRGISKRERQKIMDRSIAREWENL
ncbi:MAG: transporter substrate-binding domain-containing protein [Synergistaceae bacterium]|nr:transporter substrate-binding domain-containing protein [Synergistaceae bacterium]